MNRKEFMNLSTSAFIGMSFPGLSPQTRATEITDVSTTGYRKLGNIGLMVSPFGLGAGRVSDPDIIRLAIDRGVNVIDTARRYQNGNNEKMLGKLLKNIRKKIVLITKVHQTVIDSRKGMEKSLVESLRALKTDWIDILLIHGAKSVEDIRSQKVIDFFTRAKESGKIRFCGFSSHTRQLELLKTAIHDKFYNVVLIPYNHAGMFDHTVYGFHSSWDQVELEKQMEQAVSVGIGVIAMKTCSAGPLKVKGAEKPTYSAALKWVAGNKNVSSMTVALANFEEFHEDISVMDGVQ